MESEYQQTKVSSSTKQISIFSCHLKLNSILLLQGAVIRSRATAIRGRCSCAGSRAWLIVHSVVTFPSFLLEKSRHFRHQYANLAHQRCHRRFLIVADASFAIVTIAWRIHNQSLHIRRITEFPIGSIEINSLQN